MGHAVASRVSASVVASRYSDLRDCLLGPKKGLLTAQKPSTKKLRQFLELAREVSVAGLGYAVGENPGKEGLAIHLA